MKRKNTRDPLSSLRNKLRVLREENIPESVDTILFLGAGASQPFGYPTSEEFVKKLRLEEDEREWIRSSGFKTIDEVVRRGYELIMGEKGNTELLQAVIPNKAAELRPILPEDKQDEGVEKVRDILRIYEDAINKAKSTNEKVIEEIFREYSYRKITENYLEEYMHVLKRENGDHLPVFTTNYDPVVESLEDKKYEVNTLFTFQKRALYQWRGQEVFTGNKKKRNVIHLFKLHGSIYWRWENASLFEERIFSRTFRSREEIISPGMVVGILRNREPYITYWDYFDAYLTRASKAVFLGYRFDDGEIRGLLREKRLEKIIIVDPAGAKVDPPLENIIEIKKPAQEAVKDVEEALRGEPPHTKQTPPSEGG